MIVVTKRLKEVMVEDKIERVTEQETKQKFFYVMTLLDGIVKLIQSSHLIEGEAKLKKIPLCCFKRLKDFREISVLNGYNNDTTIKLIQFLSRNHCRDSARY